MRAQANHNGKVGLFGSCSGGRHALIYACQRNDVDACAELWGGRVVMGKEELNTKTPVAPIDMTHAGQRGLCRAQSAGVAENAAPVSGLGKRFSGRNSRC
jgi:dienelactone hydrolase